MSGSVTTDSEYNVCTSMELESWSPVAGLPGSQISGPL